MNANGPCGLSDEERLVFAELRASVGDRGTNVVFVIGDNIGCGSACRIETYEEEFVVSQ
jgi:hypothetical protein